MKIERCKEFSFAASLLSLYLETGDLQSPLVPAKQLEKNKQRSTTEISVKYYARTHCL